MAIEKKLICFARLEEFERQLTAGNILDYSIVFIQDAKKIWTRGTYYDCNSDIKQDTLVSGTNIKTINGESILGEGDISNLAEKPYVDEVLQSRVFVGTQEEYDTAYAEGKIVIGALVIILDGSETEEGGATISALLGTAILGQMLLGNK